MATAAPPAAKRFKKPELLLEHRKVIFFTCVNNIANNKFYKGFWKELSEKLPASADCCSRHWKKLRQKYEEEYGPLDQINKTTMMATIPDDFFSTNKKKTGQNSRLYYPEAVAEALKMTSRSERQTVRSTAEAVGVPKSTFHRLFKEEGACVKHSSALKPILTEFNMHKRVIFALDHIDKATINLRHLKYADDYYEIQVDEKWFVLTQDGTTYYLAPDEEKPDRRCKHKSYIDKIMFLSAVARPRRLSDGTYFDGKLGIFPFGIHQAAKRDSTNRPAGTMEWKNISVDSEVYRQWMLDEVMPSILTRWPKSELRNPRIKIGIQQDRAPGHINVEGKGKMGGKDAFDSEWYHCLEQLDLLDKFFLFDQPANSPDCNINDLGLFAAVQARYNKLPAKKNYDDIIKCVLKAYWEYPPYKINRMFLTRQQIFNEIIKCGGDNNFKIPHMGKGKLERSNKLPDRLEVCEEAKPLLWLIENGKQDAIDLMEICTPKPVLKKAAQPEVVVDFTPEEITQLTEAFLLTETFCRDDSDDDSDLHVVESPVI